MTSAKFWGFLSPAPCAHLELIYTIEFMQPPLVHPLLHDPPPPSNADILFGRSLGWWMAHLRAVPLEPKLDGGTSMLSSLSPPASGELNEAGFLAFGTALKAVNGEVEAGSAALGGSLCDCGGRRLKAVKGGAGSDAAGSATLGGSLWDCGGRRLTTCSRDPDSGDLIWVKLT